MKYFIFGTLCVYICDYIIIQKSSVQFSVLGSLKKVALGGPFLKVLFIFFNHLLRLLTAQIIRICATCSCSQGLEHYFDSSEMHLFICVNETREMIVLLVLVGHELCDMSRLLVLKFFFYKKKWYSFVSQVEIYSECGMLEKVCLCRGGSFPKIAATSRPKQIVFYCLIGKL